MRERVYMCLWYARVVACMSVSYLVGWLVSELIGRFLAWLFFFPFCMFLAWLFGCLFACLVGLLAGWLIR